MDTGPERLARLEERVEHVREELGKVSERVDEIYVLIQRGKGAKWVLMGLISLVSWAIGFALSHKILPF